jgi:hypothetical protein
MNLTRTFLVLGMLALGSILAACQTGDGAAQAVEDYVQALAEKDPDRLATQSCAAWEEQAMIELDAFAGVKTVVDGLDCQETGEDGEATIVSCAGNIVATYGNEDQNFPLDRRPFLAVQEGGEWRVCGYAP